MSFRGRGDKTRIREGEKEKNVKENGRKWKDKGKIEIEANNLDDNSLTFI
jgi:hypothetical protein